MGESILIDRNHAIITRPALASVLDNDDNIINDLLIYNRKEKLRIEDFYRKIFKKNEQQYGIIYPPGTRMFKVGRTNNALVVEEPPQMRTLIINMDLNETIAKLEKTGKLEEMGFQNFLEENPEPPYKIQLYFPYVVYIIGFTKENRWFNMSPFLRLQPITGYSDYLLECPLPNIDSDGHLCMGDSIEGSGNHEGLLGETTDIIERFWFNEFNKDYFSNYDQYRDIPYISDFLTWMYYSHTDPMFIYKAPWIKFEYNLGRVVDNIVSESTGTEIPFNPFRTIKELFTQDEKINIDDNDHYVRSITDEMWFEEACCLTVGDSIEIDNKKLYVYSFIGKPGEDPYFMECEDESGQIVKYELSNNLKTILHDQLKSRMEFKAYESVVINDFKINKGDILKFIFPIETYKYVDDIIKYKDERIEIKSGRDFYLMKNVKFELFDGKVNINGVELIKNNSYIIFRTTSENRCMIREYSIGVFNEITTSGSSLILNFSLNSYIFNSRIFDTPLNNYYSHIKIEEIKSKDVEYPKVFSYFNRLITNNYKETFIGENNDGLKYGEFAMKNSELFVRGKRNTNISSSTSTYYNRSEFSVDYILNSDRSELFIKSIGTDTQFCIGDKIVYANWEHPEIMNLILVIKEFEIKDDWINIRAGNDSGFEVFIPYVHIPSGTTQIGTVRSIITEYNGWKTGDKIKARITGIPYFPKKDTNVIIGFLNDTGTKYPLMLCSNHFTQWMHEDEMSKFYYYKKGTPEWRKQKVSFPDITRPIRIQPGDFFQYSNSISLHSRHLCFISYVNNSAGSTNNTPYIISTSEFSFRVQSGLKATTKISGYSRYGFLTPRHSRNIQDEMPIYKGFPTLYGGIIYNTESYCSFREEADYVQCMA